MAGSVDLAVEPDFLGQIPIFRGLPPQMLQRIGEAARITKVVGGTHVITEGALPREVFVVRDGELEIFKRGKHGAEVRLASLHAGDCVGEMSLIDIQPRSASVRASAPTTLYVLDIADIGRLYKTNLEGYTLLVLNIAREISRRLRHADQVLADMYLPAQDLWTSDGEGMASQP
jgi:CRP/FNR family transcriptional regulator, cyclic AMP receptor protein